MVNIPSNESLDFSNIWPNFNNLYKEMIDDSFRVLARSVVLHLPPIVVASSGLNSAAPQLNYNPIFGGAIRGAPNTVSTVRAPGVQHTPRDVIYIGHIQHGPKELDDKNFIGRLEVDECAVTLVYEALEHVMQCESVTIDNKRYRLLQNPRPIGLQIKRYIIVIFKQIPEKENV